VVSKNGIDEIGYIYLTSWGWAQVIASPRRRKQVDQSVAALIVKALSASDTLGLSRVPGLVQT
jgi:hypothetical protein